MSVLTPSETAQTIEAIQALMRSRQAVFSQLKREGKDDMAERLKGFQSHDKSLVQRLQKKLNNKKVLS